MVLDSLTQQPGLWMSFGKNTQEHPSSAMAKPSLSTPWNIKTEGFLLHQEILELILALVTNTEVQSYDLSLAISTSNTALFPCLRISQVA